MTAYVYDARDRRVGKGSKPNEENRYTGSNPVGDAKQNKRLIQPASLGFS
jgi:hypothetical protein